MLLECSFHENLLIFRESDITEALGRYSYYEENYKFDKLSVLVILLVASSFMKLLNL